MRVVGKRRPVLDNLLSIDHAKLVVRILEHRTQISKVPQEHLKWIVLVPVPRLLTCGRRGSHASKSDILLFDVVEDLSSRIRYWIFHT